MSICECVSNNFGIVIMHVSCFFTYQIEMLFLHLASTQRKHTKFERQSSTSTYQLTPLVHNKKEELLPYRYFFQKTA